jgi:DNA repair exonuclease SbcCD nuclease subunit
LRVLAYADIHHGEYGNGRTQQDMLDAEAFITQLAIDRKVDYVVFAGDAFKSRNPHDECKTRWMQAKADRALACKSYGIRQIDLVGNHCRWYKIDDSGHVFEVLELMKFMGYHVASTQDTTYFRDEDRVIFHNLPAQVSYDDRIWQFDSRRLNICVFHGMVKGCALNASGSVKAQEGIPLELLDQPEFDFVIGGDVHYPQVLPFKNTVGGYVGSTLQLTASDSGEDRGCMIITFEQGATEPQVEFVPVPQSKIIQLEWDTSSVPDLEAMRNNLVMLRINNDAGLAFVDLESKIEQFRQVARSVTPVYLPQTVVAKQTLAEHISASDFSPIDDFNTYLGHLSGVPLAQQLRIMEILGREIL